MDDLVTKDDLRQFRLLLLHDIREAFGSKNEDSEIDEPEWLRSKAIRRIMDISPGTLQNLRVTGKIRFRKVMGSYYYNKSDVMSLFQNES